MSDDKKFGDPETATNTDPDKTVSTEDTPPDTVSGGAPEPTGDGK